MVTTEGEGASRGSGARDFKVPGSAYDDFMGRYSVPLAQLVADEAGIVAGGPTRTVLDVGCGPGALTGVLVERVGASSVAACDPSEPFVAACSARFPDVDVRPGTAEALPFDDASADVVTSQLVLHFVDDLPGAASEALRVLRPGGLVAACVWDAVEGVEMLDRFWRAVLVRDPAAPPQARALRLGRPGEIADLLASAGFGDLVETTLAVSSTYTDVDELWAGFLAGIGPAGAYCVAMAEEDREATRAALAAGLPAGPFELGAVARCVTGRAPG